MKTNLSPKFSKVFSSPVQLEIQKELQNYQEALDAKVDLNILISISNKIKLLENRLKTMRSSSRN